MSSLDTNNKYLRAYAVETDQWGIDPFSDKIVQEVQKISTYTTYNVRQDERAAPDLISLRVYGDDCFWWHILAYNGICRVLDIIEGTTLRIPDLGSIVALTNTALTHKGSSNDNVVVI